MHKYYHIGIGFLGENKFQAVQDLLPKIADDWTFYSLSTWIVYTDKDPMFLTGAIRAIVGNSDLFLILEVDLSKPPGGWLPSAIWDWISKSQSRRLSGNIFAGAIDPPK